MTTNPPAPERRDGLHSPFTPGSRIGGARFILRRILGRGQCGEVWLGWDVKSEQEVALKFLPSCLVQDADLFQRFEQETRRSALLAHAAIARVYEFICDYQIAAIASEYVGGW